MLLCKCEIKYIIFHGPRDPRVDRRDTPVKLGDRRRSRSYFFLTTAYALAISYSDLIFRLRVFCATCFDLSTSPKSLYDLRSITLVRAKHISSIVPVSILVFGVISLGRATFNTLIMADGTTKIVSSDTPELSLQTSNSPSDVESNCGLLIPESSLRDGFYGYNDEKSLQQVCHR